MIYYLLKFRLRIKYRTRATTITATIMEAITTPSNIATVNQSTGASSSVAVVATVVTIPEK
jgi:hypothetical protein